MKLRVLLLDDSPMKAVAITRAIRNRCDADIEKVEDVTTGLDRIEQAEKEGCGYDLAISDMHYPLSPGLKADWEAGEHFLTTVQNWKLSLPVVICSSTHLNYENAYGCVWYREDRDWESEIWGLLDKRRREIEKGEKKL